MEPFTPSQPLHLTDTFEFECRQCGKCCRNVAHTVMLEGLDVFRIAKHLKMEIGEVINRYAEVVYLAWGVPVLILKASSLGDACLFLKDSKCSIQQANPRVCKLYPLTACPDPRNLKNFLYYKSQERDFHYTGRAHRVSDWADAHFDTEARAYLSAEYAIVASIGRILKRIPRNCEDDVERLMMLFRYFLYDTQQSFMPQYLCNMVHLQGMLEKMTV